MNAFRSTCKQVLFCFGFLVAGCGTGDEANTESAVQGRARADAGTVDAPFGQLTPLVEADTLIVPDTTNATAWLNKIDKLSYDPGAGHLLALQSQSRDVVEFSTDGDLVTRYGGEFGQGPGEILRLSDFSWSNEHILLLDRGNHRVAVYQRYGGLLREFPVSANYRSLAQLDRHTVILLPGEGEAALDVFSIRGEQLESIGPRSALPVRCTDAECYHGRTVCLSCELGVIEGRVVIVNKEQAMITVLTESGATVWSLDFFQEDDLVSSWHTADEPIRQRMAEEEAARAPDHIRTEVLKTYLLSADITPDGLMTLAVVPSAEQFRERGYELWRMDVSDGSYERYRYPRRRVGFMAAGTDMHGFFGLNPRNGGIYRFTVP